MNLMHTKMEEKNKEYAMFRGNSKKRKDGKIAKQKHKRRKRFNNNLVE